MWFAPRQQRDEGAQNGDEAAEEDDLAAMAAKQVAAELQTLVVQADVAAEARQHAKADLAPDQVAEIVTHDGAEKRRPR